MTSPKVIVCQHGARHRYAIPRMLEQAGMLEALYTDSCEYTLLGKAAKALGPLAKGSLKRLADRRVMGINRSRVFATDWPTYRYRYFRGESRVYNYRLTHESMNKELIRFGIRDADILYCFQGENLGFIQYAKENGLRIVLDVCINPLAFSKIRGERLRYDPNVNVGELDEFIKFFEQYFKSQSELSDILICPSEFVAEGVKEITPENVGRIKICPYGNSIDYGERVNDPVKGRFFWAGEDWIRKGLHYLAQAADKLTQQYRDMDFRVAGITDTRVVNMPRFKNIHFLGKLGKQQMQEEFLTADMFVFPTLAEGMVGVVLEAIAAGCPVITTRCAGIDAIENGKNGIIVSEGSEEELTAAIEQIYCDREFRNRLASNTKTLDTNYTMDAWKERLVSILRDF